MSRAQRWPVWLLVTWAAWLGGGTTAWGQTGLAALTPAEKKTLLAERDQLDRETNRLQKEGKYREALAAAGRMLALELKVFGEAHDDAVGSLERMARLHELSGDFAAAEQTWRRVLAIQARRFNPGDWRIGDAERALRELAALRDLPPAQRERLRQADRWVRQARELLGAGQYPPAAGLLTKALAAHADVLGAKHATTAGTTKELGLALYGQGESAAARRHLETAAAVQEKVLGRNHPARAATLAGLGAVLDLQGDYVGARQCHAEALAICREALGPTRPATAVMLNNLGTALDHQGDYAGARRHYEQALAIYRKALGPSHAATAVMLANLGLVLSHQGDYEEARRYYEQALAVQKQALGGTHPVTAVTLNSLGRVRFDQGDFAAAAELFSQALSVQEQALGPAHSATAPTLGNLGDVSLEQKDAAGARKRYEQALTVCRKSLGPDHPATADARCRLGVAAWRQGDDAEARQQLGQALAVYRKTLGAAHPTTAVALHHLARVLERQQDPAGARECLEEALAIVVPLLEASAAGQSERQQLAMARAWRRHLDAYLSLADRAGLPAEAVYARLLPMRGSVFLRQRLQRRLRGSDDPQVRQALARHAEVCRELAALAFADPDPGMLAACRRRVDELTRHREALEAELAGRSAAAGQGQGPIALSPAALARALPGDAALVDFLEYTHGGPPPGGPGAWRTERRLLAFVLRAGRPAVCCPLGPAAPIGKALDAWRGRLKQPLADAADDPARVVHRLVWAPLQAHVKDARTLLIVPDGVTARLPFAALPGQGPGTYLVEEHLLVTVPAPQLAAEYVAPPAKAATAPPAPSLLLLGAVDYDAAPGAAAAQAPAAPRPGLFPRWPALPGTEGEVLVIRKRFEKRFKAGRVLLLSEDEATEAALRQQASQFRSIHLATHGFFAPQAVRSALAPDPNEAGRVGPDGDVPAPGLHPGLLSGVVLAGANRPRAAGQDDGILTALEAAELDLRACELVVLSACETGLGETAGGEGVFGLQRALQVAGARGVVASLWQVDDRATAALMERFYVGLWDAQAPLGKAEALRQAQLWMLREGGRRGFHLGPAGAPADRRLPPYFWAAFTLSGDWR